jgi:hypothetical protein
MNVNDCRNVRALLGAYVDRELIRGEAARVGAHLAACAPCRAELAALERGDHAVEALGAVESAPAELDRLAARVRARMAEGEGSARARVRRGWRAERAWRSGGGLFSWPRLVPVAAAAGVLVLVLRLAERELPGVESEIARSRVTLQTTVPEDVTLLPRPGGVSRREGGPGVEPAAPPAVEKRGTAQLFAQGAADEVAVLESAPAAESVPPPPPAPVARLASELPAADESQTMEAATPPVPAPAERGAKGAAPPPIAWGGSSERSIVHYQVTPAADSIAGREESLARARDRLARGGADAAAVLLDSLLAAWGPRDRSLAAREARSLRLAAAEAAARAAGPDGERAAARGLADLYARLSGDESDRALGAAWAARAIALSAEHGAQSGDAADCRLLAARIRDYVTRYGGDARADSLARAGARLPCAP